MHKAAQYRHVLLFYKPLTMMNQRSHWNHRQNPVSYPDAGRPGNLHFAEEPIGDARYETQLPGGRTLAYVISNTRFGISCARVIAKGPIEETYCRINFKSFEEFQRYIKGDAMYNTYQRLFVQMSREVGARFK